MTQIIWNDDEIDDLLNSKSISKEVDSGDKIKVSVPFSFKEDEEESRKLDGFTMLKLIEANSMLNKAKEKNKAKVIKITEETLRKGDSLTRMFYRTNQKSKKPLDNESPLV